MSVIVPMRNAAEHVLEQVTALSNQAPREIDFEVIWVDNGSSDGTLDSSPARSAATTGCAWSRHRGAVVILRSEPGSRARPRRTSSVLRCRRRRRPALGCSRWSRRSPIWTSWVGLSVRQLRNDQRSRSQPRPTTSFPPPPTCNLGVRRAAFEALGGFNSLIRSR